MRQVIISDTGKAILSNGNASVYQDGAVPPAFRELTGIAFDGAFHYETPYRLRGSDTLKFSYSASVPCNVIGCYSGSTSTPNYSYYHTNASTGVYLRYGTNLARPRVNNGTTYTIEVTPTGATGFSTPQTWNADTFEVAGDLFVGMLDNSTSARMQGNMYGRIEVVGRMLLVPVERIADGAIGYLDLYSERLFLKTGTGTPVALGYVS